MSATARATESRVLEIESRTNAHYEPSGHLEYRRLNAKGDFILASSFWDAAPGMSDEEIKAFYTANESLIELDFDEGIAARF